MTVNDRPSHADGTNLKFSEIESLVAGVVAALCAILGTVSNIATIFSLSRSTKLRTHPTTLFLIGLALSDLLFSVFNLPLTAHRYFNRGCPNMCISYEMCLLYPYVLYGNVGVSIYIMTLIAVQRLVGLCKPEISKYFTKSTVPVMIVLVWIFVFGVLALPLTRVWGQFGYEPLTFSCTFMKSNNHQFVEIVAVFGVFLPCCVICASYLTMYCKVRRSGRSVLTRGDIHVWRNNNCSGNKNSKNCVDFRIHIQKRERDVTKTVFYIFVSYIACFIPFALVMVVDPMTTSNKSTLHLLTYFLSWSSAFINPIIYCYTNKHYRAAFSEALLHSCTTASNTTSSQHKTMDCTVKNKLHNQNNVGACQLELQNNATQGQQDRLVDEEDQCEQETEHCDQMDHHHDLCQDLANTTSDEVDDTDSNVGGDAENVVDGEQSGRLSRFLDTEIKDFHESCKKFEN